MFAGLVGWIQRPMSPWARARTILSLLFVWGIVLEGAWKLELLTLKVYGGFDKLFLFQKMEEHRYTAMAMLTGTLRLRASVGKIGHDEQVFNGAGYTNWGFGVPLLQLPFHRLLPWIPGTAAKYFPNAVKFFPDRAIFFFYLTLLIPVLWAAIDELLSLRAPVSSSRLRRHILSWTITGCVLTMAVFPLMASRFQIYEETVTYLVVFELFAVAAYLFTLRSGSKVALVGLGAAAGIGLLIRPTGLVYLGVWGALVLLERRAWRTIVAFGSGLAPFLAFWLYSNWVRSGSPFSAGISNSLPWFDYHTAMLRFGPLCANTPHHALEAAARLFSSFFMTISDDPTPWMKKCHFDFEDRPPPTLGCWTHEPFFFYPVVFLALAWMFLHQLRRERRLAFYLPSLALGALFCAYAIGVGGFAWRYAGDFWPLMILAAVQYFRFLPKATMPLFGLRMAFLFLGAGFAMYTRFIVPSIEAIETLDPSAEKGMWDDFTNSRYSEDKTFSNVLTCESHPDFPYHNGQGWKSGCGVDTFTNVYIGVPEKQDDHYVFSFKTEGVTPPTLRVYVNGRIYVARRTPNGYAADVNIHFDRLSSPTVMATIEWVRDVDPIPVRLLSIQLS